MPNFPNEDLRVGFVQIIDVRPKVVSPELASRSLIPFVQGISLASLPWRYNLVRIWHLSGGPVVTLGAVRSAFEGSPGAGRRRCGCVRRQSHPAESPTSAQRPPNSLDPVRASDSTFLSP
jgi:hypothetical protein